MPASPTRLWTLTKGARTTTCEANAHPLGLEVRYHVDGELIRSQVVKDTPALECHANDARAAFEAAGWTTAAESS